MTTGVIVSKVELTDDGVELEWSDGHLSKYESKYLRINCACAECVVGAGRAAFKTVAADP